MPPASPATSAKQRLSSTEKAVEKSVDNVTRTAQALTRAQEKHDEDVRKAGEALTRARTAHEEAIAGLTETERRRDHALTDPDLPDDVRAEAEAVKAQKAADAAAAAQQQGQQPEGQQPGAPDVGGNTEVGGDGQPLAPVVAANEQGDVVPVQGPPN